MLLSISAIPLALYIHIPWCVKKCPYCDFNSHELGASLDNAAMYSAYVDALLADASAQVPWLQGRQISSVFIGGGTPSLLPIAEYQRLFQGLRERLPFVADCEVTMEANPGTLEHAPFAEYLEVGINRLSIGVQSFDGAQLTTLGRIHDPQQAQIAIGQARRAGFTRVNVDLMHGLPTQTSPQALHDIQQAHDAGATHISWYQLTVEPNTVFYRNAPLLPDEDALADIEEAGQALLKQLGYRRYEVSAWAGEHDRACQHNVNYWQFGDYLAIGAGAHGKISLSTDQAVEPLVHGPQIARFSKSRLPKDYLDQEKWQVAANVTPNVNFAESESDQAKMSLLYPKTVGFEAITQDQLPAEFMLNALRLEGGVAWQTFTERTGLAKATIAPQVAQLIAQGLLVDDAQHLCPTEQGRRYLNQVLYAFL
jgi:oxygen-independent coproporphyrinogen-3 oxidase